MNRKNIRHLKTDERVYREGAGKPLKFHRDPVKLLHNFLGSLCGLIIKSKLQQFVGHRVYRAPNKQSSIFLRFLRALRGLFPTSAQTQVSQPRVYRETIKQNPIALRALRGLFPTSAQTQVSQPRVYRETIKQNPIALRVPVKLVCNFLGALRGLLFCLALFGLAMQPVDALDVLAFSYQVEDADKKKDTGVLVQWSSQRRADYYQLYINGSLVEKIEVKDSQSQTESILGERYEGYKKRLKSKKGKALNDSQFMKLVHTRSQVIKFLAVYDERLVRVLGWRYRDKNANLPKTRTYKVVAYRNGSAIESGQSRPVVWGQYPIIAKPSLLTGKIGHESATLEWSPPINNNGVIGYNVYVSKKKDKGYRLANDRPITIFNATGANAGAGTGLAVYTVTKLKNKTKYFFKVASVHFNRMQSDFEGPIELKPQDNRMPEPPALEALEQDQPTPLAKLRWAKPEAANVSYYNVYRSNEMMGKYTKINKAPVSVTALKYNDRGPFDYKKLYWYRITAVNTVGDESVSSAAVFFKPMKMIAPSRVRFKKVTPKPGQIHLEIIPIKDGDLLRYDVFRRNGTEGPFAKIGVLKKEKKVFKDFALEATQFYCYRIRAVDTRGNLSAEMKPRCARPLNGKALGPPDDIKALEDQGGVVLRWKYKTQSILEGFIILKKKAKGKYKLLTKQPLTRGLRMYIDKTAQAGESLSYKIKTVAKNGVVGVASHSISIRLRARRPAPVTNLQLHQSAKQIIISWEYYGKARQFEIEARRIEDQKVLAVGKTKSKQYRWPKPKNGNYEIWVRAVGKKNNRSVRKEYRRIEVR